jgi:hypothetical protein
MKNPVIANPSSHYIVITTTIVYALLAPVFFEMDNNNALGEGEEKFVIDDKIYTQQQLV